MFGLDDRNVSLYQPNTTLSYLLALELGLSAAGGPCGRDQGGAQARLERGAVKPALHA